MVIGSFVIGSGIEVNASSFVPGDVLAPGADSPPLSEHPAKRLAVISVQQATGNSFFFIDTIIPIYVYLLFNGAD
ncbi:hypothetical protein GCM10023310_27060 [Paenibacillus vulneris]